MVLTSKTTALITQTRLDEINDEYDRTAIKVEVWSTPIDPETEPELLCEKKIAREE